MATIERRPPPKTPGPNAPNPIPSSSPAFATPAHPIRPPVAPKRPLFNARIESDTTTRPTVLPISLPAATLRPIAFRTFTKKHNLTITSSALQLLANFVGRHCGASWREEGLAELVLEDVARSWKRLEGKLIVEGSATLKDILKQLDGGMSGGRIVSGKTGVTVGRRESLVTAEGSTVAGALQRQDSFGMSNLEVEDDEDEHTEMDARKWLKTINAYDQPRFVYNASKKHFEKSKAAATLFPPPSQKTELFRQRYHILQQRVLRNEAFQTLSVASSNRKQWKITPIANLLGRSGSGHLLLGLLTVAPAGTLAISDLTGSIHLDLSQATPLDDVETWLCPGMIILVDGVYEEEYHPAGGSLGNTGGIGGTIGGRFIGFSLGPPRCETRAATLGLAESSSGLSNLNIGGGFGWVDFLGTGSEKAAGPRMRKIEQRLLHANDHDRRNSNKVVVIGSCALDNPKTLSALRSIFASYSPTSSTSSKDLPRAAASDQTPPKHPPLAFILLGSFVTQPAMSVSASSISSSTNTSGNSSSIPDSITYKEAFDALAAVLSDFPNLLRSCTFVFVPGDSDPWPSAFSAGAAVPLPRQGIPDVFTSRIRRAFANANQELSTREGRVPGEAVWTSNPARISMFGPSCEMVLFRDDISGRMRRNHIPLQPKHAEEEMDESTVEEPAKEAAAGSAEQSDEPSQPQTTPENGADGEADPDVMDIEPPHNPAPASSKAAKKKPITTAPQRLTKTILDQSHVSPFPLDIRPQHWSYGSSALSLYPLPSVLVLCDTEIEPFVLGYQGCTVVNAGRVVEGPATGKHSRTTWCEYDVLERKGAVRVL